MKTVALYMRCSTGKQDVALQRRDLLSYCARHEDWTIVEYVDEGVSGSKIRRPALDRLMTDVRQGKVDVVAVWKFDRLARSLKQLIDTLTELRERGIAFVSYTEQLDTNTAAGRLLFGILGSFAEFERSLIVERVRAGLATARAKGVTLGRPRIDVDVPKARKLRKEGLSYRQIGEKLKTSTDTVRRTLTA